MIRRLVFILLLLAVPILACATPALAQTLLQPGDYTLDWVVQYNSGIDGSLVSFQAGIDRISLLSTDGLDASSPYRGLCSTPYVTLGPPHSPEFGGTAIWCLNADGTLGDSSAWFAFGGWTLYSPTVALINVSQGYHGSRATDAITAIARLVPRPPPATLKVFITQPKATATVSGTAWIVLWVEGTSGAANTFTLSADGTQIATRTTTARGPVSIPWPTTALPNGTHTLTGTVRDATGNTGTTTMTVIVSNVTNTSLTPGTGQLGLD